MTVIPVKGRRVGTDTVTVTRNEILAGITSSLRYSALVPEGVIVKKLMPDSLLHVLGVILDPIPTSYHPHNPHPALRQTLGRATLSGCACGWSRAKGASAPGTCPLCHPPCRCYQIMVKYLGGLCHEMHHLPQH